MFAKLLGKEKKPAQVAQPVNPQAQLSTSLKYEKTLHDIKMQRAKIDESTENIEQKVVKLDQEIRSLMSQGKKQQAKGKIAEMKGYQKQIEGYQVKYNVLTQMMIQIETLEQDAGIAGTIDEVGKLAKEQEATNEKLQDGMLNWQEFQQSQQETQELFKQMSELGTNNEEIDEEFAKYEMEANQQQAQKAANDFNKVPQQTIPQVQQPIYQQPQQQQNVMQSHIQQLLD